MPALSCIKLSPPAINELSQLVWQVLRAGVTGQQYHLPVKSNSIELEQNAATFITLYNNEQLSGCIGGYQANQPLWQSACQHAYSSAFEDYRFTKLTAQELSSLRIELSILSELQIQQNVGETALAEMLKPNLDGLLLSYQNTRALFLPCVWQSLPSPYEFLRALKEKAGWQKDFWSEHIEISVFRSQSYQLKE